MPDRSLTCVVCSDPFVYTEREQLYLARLHREGKLPELFPPKRCMPCRDRKKGPAKPPAEITHQHGAAWKSALQEIATVQTAWPKPQGLGNVTSPEASPQVNSAVEKPQPSANAAVQEPAQVGAPPAIKYDPAPLSPDLRCILVAGDFERLLRREEVVIRAGSQKVTIILADIGIEALKKAMDHAVMQWWRS